MHIPIDRNGPFLRRTFAFVISCSLALSGTLTGTSCGQDPVAPVAQIAPVAQSAPAAQSDSVRPGINDNFLNPELDVSQWLGRFEVESREVYSARTNVLDALELNSGARVADVGAGTGFFARLFSKAVGDEGWVFAVDISPRFLEHINRRSQADGISNLTAVFGGSHSINLPPNSVDLVFICDTYHHFEFPAATLQSIHRALREGGRLVVIDFERILGKSREFILGHVRGGKEVFRGEIEAAGFAFEGETQIEGFVENYFIRFRKK